MAGPASPRHWIEINRAPVLALWAAVVAERLGYRKDEALTLGRAVAGLNAYSKGRALGLFRPTPEAVRKARKERRRTAGAHPVDLLGRAVPTVATDEGLRALSKDKPIDPAAVTRYLEKKFGEGLGDATDAMRALAKAHRPRDLAEVGFDLYVAFRPEVAKGVKGWGQAGRLSLDRIRAMADEAAT